MDKTFNCFPVRVVFMEVPDEVSLAFTITGCPLRCQGCHSVDTWNAKKGEPLTFELFSALLRKYQGLITCVVFFGGEWQPCELVKLLRYARAQGLKTCLYTGLSNIQPRIRHQLTYLKTGSWQPARGGLDNENSNQRFTRLADNQLLNFKFWGTPNASL